MSELRPITLVRSCGARLPVATGESVLEALRRQGIPHASICGGKARCTTCRIRVVDGLESLPAADALEMGALTRIGAPPTVRLACQLRPTADLRIVPLLPCDISIEDVQGKGGLDGRELAVVVLFVDLRESTTMAEARMPYDVLFILNRFFLEMNRALVATGGYYSNFTGDGLMALYGLEDKDCAQAAKKALAGAQAMLDAMARINRDLATELLEPLRIGIGPHAGKAIVGSMGPPRSQITSAIGDTVNTAARMESLTKDFNCAVVVSRQVAAMAGLDLPVDRLHLATVKGRAEAIEVFALDRLS